MDFEIEVNSIEQYLSVVFELSNEIEKILVYHQSLYFRGHTNKEYKLLPAIARERKSAVDISILDEERNMIEMVKYKLSSKIKRDLAPIDLLAILQHYGIPTRLLDITSNPLVALYFAVEDLSDNDAEVIIFKEKDSDIANYPIINAIAESYKFVNSTWCPLDSFYRSILEQPYFLEQRYRLNECYKTQQDGARWIKKCCSDLLIVHATEESQRQKAQQGRYILFPNDIKEEGSNNYQFYKYISEIPKDYNHIYKRVLISSKNKYEIKKKLKILGISKDSIFPDSIDCVCEGIKEDAKLRVSAYQEWSKLYG